MSIQTKCARLSKETVCESTICDLQESIETNLWLAEGYSRRGAANLAAECLRSAWHEYTRFRDVLGVYGGEELGVRLAQALRRGGVPFPVAGRA